MTAIAVALVTGIVVWFVVASRLTAKSWRHDEQKGDVGAIRTAPSRIGLWIFMAVVVSLFSLFLAAYSMRMQHGFGWCHLTIPNILWVNTGVLLAASIVLQMARWSVDRGHRAAARNAVIAGGALSVAFLVGQVLAFDAVGPSLYYIQGSPAIAFFYVLTILHGLHLLGGLYVLGRAAWRFAAGVELVDLRLTVQLCSVYWHFLLLVWFAVFAVLRFL